MQLFPEEIEDVMKPYQSQLISTTKMAEIKSYTANEVFRVRKRTDALYEEFDKVR